MPVIAMTRTRRGIIAGVAFVALGVPVLWSVVVEKGTTVRVGGGRSAV